MPEPRSATTLEPVLRRPDLVASDLDGTLLPPSLQFLPLTARGINELRGAGVPFVVSTGRMFKSARHMVARLGLTSGPIVCYQGALVADLGSGAWERHLPIPPAIAAEVVVAMRELDRHVNVYVDDEFYVEQDDAWARRYAEYAEVGLDVVPDLLDVVAHPPTKIVISTEPDDVTALLPGLQARWHGRLYVTRSLPHFIEVSDPTATKSSALAFLCDTLGRPRAHGGLRRRLERRRHDALGRPRGGGRRGRRRRARKRRPRRAARRARRAFWEARGGARGLISVGRRAEVDLDDFSLRFRDALLGAYPLATSIDAGRKPARSC